MGTIAEKLLQLNATKEEIKNAIEAKGVIVAPENPFSEYPAKISQIALIPPIRITRPLDWPDISELNPNEIKLLVKSGSEVVFTLYTVDSMPYYVVWGDTDDPQPYNSGMTIWRFMEETGTPCSEGYNTVVIKIWGDTLTGGFQGYEKFYFGEPSPNLTPNWSALSAFLDFNFSNIPRPL